MKESIEQKRLELETRKRQLDSHKKFSVFLQSVVKDEEVAKIIAAGKTSESGKSDQEGDIDWLRNRFINLKKQNKLLKQRKAEINSKMEAVKADERQKVQEMTAQMYAKSQLMQRIQNEIEEISSKNSQLENDFESQVDKQNKRTKEAGQIINSIESIYMLCLKVKEAKKKSSQNAPKAFENIDMGKVEAGDKKHTEEFI